MMNGELRLASPPGKGTRVQVELAFALTASLTELSDNPEQPPDVALQQPSLDILIVDDHKPLGYLGHKVTLAEDGLEGLERCNNHRCVMAGMNECIFKPVNLDLLQQKIALY